jgi:predicted amidohydrolase
MENKKIKVGILQYAPVYLNLKASLELLASLLKTAAAQGIELAVLGECWLSGYPAWLDHCPDAAKWNHEGAKQVWQKFYKNSLVVGGPDTETISKLCQEYNISLMIGVNERVTTGHGQGTVYNSLLTFSNTGVLLNHHRKLMPTYSEKLLYGVGDARGLKSVATDWGKLGGLICWEHWMPLSRQALHNSGEDIHVAVWPSVHEMHQTASKHYAFEGRCFVLAAGQILKASELPTELPLPPELQAKPNTLLLNGGSAIYAPNGNCLTEPLYNTEGLVVADLDLGQCIRERMTLDVSGHYQRPDVFNFSLR